MNISSTAQIYQTSITGEVVEVFQQENKFVTTMLIKPFTLKFENIKEACLGDEATIEISFSINAINFNHTLGGTHE